MPDLDALFAPKSIALVGASPDKHIIRGRIVDAVRQHPFDGPIFAVSRSHSEIDGIPCFASVDELPQAVDLAIVAIPAEHVADALEACGRRGVRAAVVVSSGFAEERGEAGRERQRALAEVARRHDIALLGPNGEGFMSSRLPLAATFSPAVMNVEGGLVPEGTRAEGIAVVSQSGGIGFSFFHRGRPKELAFSYVVTTGNEAGLDVLDVVDWLVDDDATGVILVFLEGLRRPARFLEVAAKAARAGKPLVVAKMGRSEAAALAATSHTGSLAGEYRTHMAVFRRYGVIAADDIDQMIDVAAAFAFYRRRLPRGTRTGVLTPSGGAGIWLADAAAAAGLEVPELDAATRETIGATLPAYGATRNPVDVTAQVIFAQGYSPALEAMAGSPTIDSVLVAGSLSHARYIERDLDALTRLGATLDKPVIFCAYTRAHPDAVRLLAQAGFPCFTSMPNSARAMRSMAEYAAFLDRFERDERGAAEAWALPREAAAILEGGARVLFEHEAKRALAACGVAVAPGVLVASAAEAGAAAARLAAPLALKVQSPDVAHKTDAGGVALGVEGEAAARAAFDRICASVRARHPDADLRGVLVEPMAAPGVEMIVGATRDAQFGPMVLVGLGGVLVEVLEDVALAPAPITEALARELIDSLHGRAMLEGVRGAPPADVDALAALVAAVSRLAATGDAIAEIDLNPVLVHPRGEGVTVVDALVVKRAGVDPTRG